MKKTFTYLSFIIFLGWFPLLFAGEIYVSLQGNDKNPGTKEAPFNTLNRAIKQAREWRRLNRPEVAGGIYIRLEEGVYVQSPNQKIPDRKTKCVIKTHINIKQNVIFSAKLKPV